MKLAYNLAILASICLLAVPAYSMPNHGGNDNNCGMQGPMMADDLTPEEMDNMTLAEIRAYHDEQRAEMDNMTLAEIKALKEENKDNTTCPMGGMGPAQGPAPNQDKPGMGMGAQQGGMMGPAQGQQGPAPNQDKPGMGMGAQQGGMMGPAQGQQGPAPNQDKHGMGFDFLIGDDLTQEEMDNMTLAEIRDYRDEQRATMENMTLAEIKSLREQKMQEMDNMTLSELKEQTKGFKGPEGNQGPDGKTECPMGGQGPVGPAGGKP